jgi:hypothetical protein
LGNKRLEDFIMAPPVARCSAKGTNDKCAVYYAHPAVQPEKLETASWSPFTSLLTHFKQALGLAEIPRERRMVEAENEVRISDSSFDIGPTDKPFIHVGLSELHGVLLSPVSGISGQFDAIFRLKVRPGKLQEVYGGTFPSNSGAYARLKTVLKSRALG